MGIVYQSQPLFPYDGRSFLCQCPVSWLLPSHKGRGSHSCWEVEPSPECVRSNKSVLLYWKGSYRWGGGEEGRSEIHLETKEGDSVDTFHLLIPNSECLIRKWSCSSTSKERGWRGCPELQQDQDLPFVVLLLCYIDLVNWISILISITHVNKYCVLGCRRMISRVPVNYDYAYHPLLCF